MSGTPKFLRETKVLTIPGLYNSVPDHWQSLWEREFPGMERVDQDDWNTPVCGDWIAKVEAAVQRAGIANVVLVAHSLGCATVAHWARANRHPIKGALLVAPSDVEASTYPEGTKGFAPLPLQKLPFSSIVVASSNDPYVSVDRARLFAKMWGSKYRELKEAGHIDSNSRLGRWELGLGLLKTLL